MKIFLALLKWAGYLWTAGAGLFVVLGIADIGMRKGWPAVQDFLGPSHVINWVIMALTIAPGPLAVSWTRTLAEEEASLHEREMLWKELQAPRTPSENA